MSAASDEVYRRLETNYFSKTDNWHKAALDGAPIPQSVMDEMVAEKFGGYGQNISFTIGTTRYKAKMLEPQNKFKRQEKTYSDELYSGGETLCNLIINQVAPFSNKANLHILLQTAKAERAAAIRAAKKTVDSDGFSTV